MDFWNELFTSLDSKESWLVLFWVGLAAFLGLLIGLTLRGFGVSKWKRRFRSKESELRAVQAEMAALKEKYALQEADLQKARLRTEELEAQVRRTDLERTQLQNDLSVYEQQYNGLKTNYEENQTERQRLIEEVAQLKAQLSQRGPGGDLSAFQAEFESTKTQLNALAQRLEQLEEENDNLKDELDTVQAIATGQPPQQAAPETTSRSVAAPDALTLAMIEEKISAIEDENILLRQELSDLRGDQLVETVVRKTVPRDINPLQTELPEDDIDEKDLAVMQPISPEERSAQATARLTAALGERIPRATEAERDDLKRINGIGPFIEKKLNSLGLFTYEQISSLDAELIATLTNAIQFFPGRIERDDWVGQAATLHRSANKSPVAAAASSSPDDLKVVEGIGPKIEQLLKDNDIHTWEELSRTEITRLKDILDAAGGNYRTHSPATWPDQAKLASLGEWDKLQQFQRQLSSGKSDDTD